MKMISMGAQYRLAATEACKEAKKATGLQKQAWLQIEKEWLRLAEASDKAERET